MAAALALPPDALAHVANIEYRFPLPVWLYAVAGAVAVLASAPAAAVALRVREDRLSRNLYPAIAPLRLGPIAVAVATALLGIALVAGFFNDEVGFFNPAPVLFWVDFWVGIGIVSALVANVWDFVSPLSAAGRWIERRLAVRDVAARAYPELLGVWPAVGLLLAFSWMELVWDEGTNPRTIAVVVLWYLAVQLAGIAAFGAETWLGRAELFTVFARTLSRLAPVELYVTDSESRCRAGRCEPGTERIGCPACWLDAPPERRGVRLRAYGAGVRREPALRPGGSAFVVALLGTVVYDGLTGTSAYRDLRNSVLDLLPGLSRAGDTIDTLMMVLVLGAFAGLFLLVAVIVARLEGESVATVTGRYAPTLIPIAAVYFCAHYVLYLFYGGQLTLDAVFDPLGRGWFPGYRPWTGVPGEVVWLVQASLIVWGHVVAVIEAHRISLCFHGRARSALVSQLPLVALMVVYTFTGLWVLGQALAGVA